MSAITDPKLLYILNKNNQYIPLLPTTVAERVLYDINSNLSVKEKINNMERSMGTLTANLTIHNGNRVNLIRDYNNPTGDGSVYINRNSSVAEVRNYYLYNGKLDLGNLDLGHLDAKTSAFGPSVSIPNNPRVDRAFRILVDGSIEMAKAAKFYDNVTIEGNLHVKRTLIADNFTSNTIYNKQDIDNKLQSYMKADRGSGTAEKDLGVAKSLRCAVKENKQSYVILDMYTGIDQHGGEITPREVAENWEPGHPYLAAYDGNNFMPVKVSEAKHAITANKVKNRDLVTEFDALQKIKVGSSTPDSVNLAVGELYFQYL